MCVAGYHSQMIQKKLWSRVVTGGSFSLLIVAHLLISALMRPAAAPICCETGPLYPHQTRVLTYSFLYNDLKKPLAWLYTFSLFTVKFWIDLPLQTSRNYSNRTIWEGNNLNHVLLKGYLSHLIINLLLISPADICRKLCVHWCEVFIFIFYKYQFMRGKRRMQGFCVYVSFIHLAPGVC